MKKISIVLVSILSLLFISDVKAYNDVYNNYSNFDNLTEDNLIAINNFLADYFSSSKNFKVICTNKYNTVFNDSFYCFELPTNSKLTIRSSDYWDYFSFGTSSSFYVYNFNINLNTNSITYKNRQSYKYLRFNTYGSTDTLTFNLFIWSNKLYKFSDLFVVNDDSHYPFNLWSTFNNSLNERYKKFEYTTFITDTDDYYYTIYNRVTGNLTSDIVTNQKNFEYKIYYYFDDVLNTDYTKTLEYTGILGDELILNDLDLVIGNYTLFDENEYKIVFKDSDNSINVYYRSEMYNKQFYTLNIYLNDVLSSKYSITTFGDIDSLIDLTDYEIIEDIYKTDLTDINFVINANRELNNFNLYYYSDNYGTDFADIILESDIYLFFSYSDLKERFPSINWSSFNQFQQLIITLGFNLFFCLFILLMLFIVFRLLAKLFSYIL